MDYGSTDDGLRKYRWWITEVQMMDYGSTDGGLRIKAVMLYTLRNFVFSH
ncbi:MAG: hypothetical protein KBB64_12470 [Bacteroidia bacterium]|nr:hypothetical protein [Bacteroidia bacterium]